MNYTTLINVEELVSLKQTEVDICIFDCRFNLADTAAGELAWAQGHIPDAFYAHLDNHLSSPVIPGKTGRHPLPSIDKFINFLQESGVTANTQIIAYDDANGAMASRLWWLCRWIGHLYCAVLDGGYQSWKKVGPVSTKIPAVKTAGDIAAQDALLETISTESISTDSSSSFILVDARDQARFSGEVEPIDPVAGHIPGAVCIPFSENTGSSGKFLDKQQLKQRFECLSQSYRNRIPVMYCGSGVTAAHNVLAMTHAGLDTPALYADSWSGWIIDPNKPVATGE